MSPGASKAILHAADLLTREAVLLRQSHTRPGTDDWGDDLFAKSTYDDMARTAIQLHDIAWGVIE